MQVWTAVSAFFNSNFFVALSTVFTIGGGIYLYFLQKREQKQQIAILLINDIRNAQDAIQSVRDSLHNALSIPEIIVLPENNWKKYSYLFSKDLDPDNLHSVNRFFTAAERISYIVVQANNMFLTQISNRSAAMQNENVRKISEATTMVEARDRIRLFDEIFASPQISNSPYIPQGFFDKLNNYLPDIQDLLNSPAGEKLKMIAEPKRFKLNLFSLKKSS